MSWRRTSKRAVTCSASWTRKRRLGAKRRGGGQREDPPHRQPSSMSVWTLVCAAGMAALGCGVLVGLVVRRWRAALAVQAAGMAAVGAAGAAVLFGAPSIGAPFRNGYSPALGIDRLSGFFLLVLAL